MGVGGVSCPHQLIRFLFIMPVCMDRTRFVSLHLLRQACHVGIEKSTF